jgi:hypothetical protein
MPVRHVVAMILASKPPDAVSTLLAMTPDRIDVLLDEIPPVNLGRLICAARPREQETLMSTLSSRQRRAALSTLSTVHLVRLVAALPPESAWAVLADMSPGSAAGLFAELPVEPRRRLESSPPPELSPGLASAMYVRSVVETIVRTASRTTWLDEGIGDVLAEVFGKFVHIAARYGSGLVLEAREVVAAARRARWNDIVGMLVCTNMQVSESADAQAAAIRRAGSPIEVIHWLDPNDDGVFKRSLVRLVG